MPVRTQCPAGHKLIVPDDRAGQRLRCPRCDAAFTVPGVQGSGFRVQEETKTEPPSPVTAHDAALERLAAVLDQPTVVHRAREEPRPEPAPLTEISSPKPESRSPPIVGQPPARLAPDRPAEPVVKTRAAEAICAPTIAADALPADAPPVRLVAKAEPPPDVPEPVKPEMVFGPLMEATVEPRPTAAAPAEVAQPVIAEPPIHSSPVELPVAADSVPADMSPVEETNELVASQPAALPDRHWLPAVYWLAAGMIAAALFGIAPAAWDVVDYLQYYDEAADPHVARWALVLILLGVVQTAYAIYLFQLPDWTSVWVVTLYSLALAGLYALGLGLVLISGDDGLLVGPRGLQLADKLASGKAGLWCVAMTCVSTIIAFFAGRLSAQWRRAESLVRSTVQ